MVGARGNPAPDQIEDRIVNAVSNSLTFSNVSSAYTGSLLHYALRARVPAVLASAAHQNLRPIPPHGFNAVRVDGSSVFCQCVDQWTAVLVSLAITASDQIGQSLPHR